MDDPEKMRAGVSKARGIDPFEEYSEAQAAGFLRIDHTTLKRMRREGKTPHTALGERHIRYLGDRILDMIIFGDRWSELGQASRPVYVSRQSLDIENEARERVAKAKGIAMFRQYDDAKAAEFLRTDVTEIERMRRAGEVPYMALGDRQIGYLGIHIIDMILFADKWRDIKDGST